MHAEQLQAMLANKFKIFKFVIIFFLLTFSNLLASTDYFKCPEKITNVLKGGDALIKVGSLLGTNYVKFVDLDSPFRKVNIKFKYLNQKEKAFVIINDETLNQNTLGYEVFYNFSDNEMNVENTYKFIKINDTYAFTRKEFWWSKKKLNNEKTNYEYESSGRCIKINQDEYKNEKVSKVVSSKKSKEIKKKVTKKQNKTSIIGERSFAMSWEGYDDLIAGKIKFSEKDLLGRIEFSLPNNDGDCFGTYVLSTLKGTWSIICNKKNINASGFLEWNNINGSVRGNGKDSNEKIIRFKVAEVE